jgi:hypothetical protein
VTDEGAPDPLDVLYGAPPAEFVETRKRLAAERAKAGDKEGAAALKLAQKPAVSAWAVNLAVRRAAQGVADLIDASEDLVKAQLAAGHDRDRLQAAMAAQRKSVDALTEVAARALEDAGQNVTPALRERIAGNLRWAALSEEQRPLLLAGRLVKDVPPQDFTALALKATAGGGGAAAGRPVLRLVPADKREAAREARAKAALPPEERKHAEAERRRQLQAQVAELRTAWREAREETRKAEKVHERAEAELARRRDDVAARKQALAEAEQELADARKALGEAETQHGAARRTFDNAERAERERAQAVSQAEEQLKDAKDGQGERDEDAR